MPLFGRHSTEQTAPAPEPTYSNGGTTHKSGGGGLFGRRRSASPTSPANHATAAHSPPARSGGFLNRHSEDPSIVAARERVLRAEAAERDADRALFQARAAVREAREEVKRLEREAAEEARMAKIKQNQAKSISKRAKPLGRHEHV